MARPELQPRVYIATSTGVVKIKGVVHQYVRGRTVPADSPLLKALPGRFQMVDLDRVGVVIGTEAAEA